MGKRNKYEFDLPNEFWKEVKDEKFSKTIYVSNMGRFRDGKGFLLTPAKHGKLSNGYDGKMCLKLPTKNGKSTTVYAHNIVAKAFLERQNDKNPSYKVNFIDEDFTNIIACNLKWAISKYLSKGKYKLVFTDDKDEIIKLIKSNENKKNILENNNIIEYLNGNNNGIWGLFKKYKGYYQHCINNSFNNKSKIKNKGSIFLNKKEAAETIEDICMDGFMFALEKIKTGRFDGRNFKNWSAVVVVNFYRKWKCKKLTV